VSRVPASIVAFSVLVFASWPSMAIADHPSAESATAEAKAPERTTTNLLRSPQLASADPTAALAADVSSGQPKEPVGWLAMGGELAIADGDKESGDLPGGAPLGGQGDEGGGQAEELAKKLQNPIANLISVPIQLDYDRGLGPNGDGSLWQMNIQPVIPFSLNKDWNLISRTIVPIIHQEDLPTRGHSKTGLGDVLQSFFLSPSELTDRGWVWGVGPVISFPTACDDALGTGKWGLGPTVVALKQEGPWTVGALANHVWSVAGDSDRADVSATYLEPWVSYTTKENTTISMSVETVYDWDTEEISAPVNLIVEQLLQVGEQYISVGASVHYWAASSPGGPEGFGFGLQVTFLFPK
jgi:hypothetical protein